MVSLDQEAGKSFSYEEVKSAVETNKPAVLFLCQVCVLPCWRTAWHRAALLYRHPELHGSHARVSCGIEQIWLGLKHSRPSLVTASCSTRLCRDSYEMCAKYAARHCQDHALSLPVAEQGKSGMIVHQVLLETHERGLHD